MTDARTSAIRANTKALNRLADAQEAVAEQMKISNMLEAAAFSANGIETRTNWARALHLEAITLIGVKP